MINTHNIEIEQAVLAALMGIESAYDEVSDKIGLDTFFADRHKTIYEAIVALKKNAGRVDALLVLEWLESRKRAVLAGGEAYLSELLINSPASLFNLASYVERLNDLAVRRSSLAALDKAKDQVINNPDRPAHDVVSDAISDLSGSLVLESDQGAVDMDTALNNQIMHMQEVYANPSGCFGQRTGFTELDAQIGGMSAGDLIVIGARPAMGKTTFAMNIVDFAASDSGDPWLVASCEMPTIQLTERMIAASSGVRLGNIRLGKLDPVELQKYSNAVKRLRGVPIRINDKGQQTLGEIRREALALKRKHGVIGGIMIDYIGIMGGIDPNNKVNSIAVISGGLKALAKELACPVIVLSQLNRGLEQRPNKRPVMSDLRESGAIEQDADIIMFLYRDEVYHKDTQAVGVAEVIIGKQRNGPIGTVCLGFRGEFSRFENLMNGYQGESNE